MDVGVMISFWGWELDLLETISRYEDFEVEIKKLGVSTAKIYFMSGLRTILNV